MCKWLLNRPHKRYMVCMTLIVHCQLLERPCEFFVAAWPWFYCGKKAGAVFSDGNVLGSLESVLVNPAPKTSRLELEIQGKGHVT